MTGRDLAGLIRSSLRPVADYPREGVVFRDIAPLLADRGVFGAVIDDLAETYRGQVDAVAGIEARGFLLAAPLAWALGCGVVPLRKPGKLPPPVLAQTYDLEYGTDELQIPADTPMQGARVVLVDDVLATGGTARAGAALLERRGLHVVSIAVLLELVELGGRDALAPHTVHALLRD